MRNERTYKGVFIPKYSLMDISPVLIKVYKINSMGFKEVQTIPRANLKSYQREGFQPCK